MYFVAESRVSLSWIFNRQQFHSYHVNIVELEVQREVQTSALKLWNKTQCLCAIYVFWEISVCLLI